MGKDISQRGRQEDAVRRLRDMELEVDRAVAESQRLREQVGVSITSTRSYPFPQTRKPSQ